MISWKINASGVCVANNPPSRAFTPPRFLAHDLALALPQEGPGDPGARAGSRSREGPGLGFHPPSGFALRTVTSEIMSMVKVYNKETGECLGRITTAELDYLKGHLESEGLQDHDFYLRRETVEGFAAQGAPLHLVEMLQSALRFGDAVEIQWKLDEPAKV
jgi:hypothetical protein